MGIIKNKKASFSWLFCWYIKFLKPSDKPHYPFSQTQSLLRILPRFLCIMQSTVVPVVALAARLLCRALGFYKWFATVAQAFFFATVLSVAVSVGFFVSLIVVKIWLIRFG